MLIDAAARLKAAGKLEGAVVVLAGDAQGRDAYVQALHDQVAQAGLEPHVRFVGHVEDIAAAYLAAHVTVVASTEPEAFGRAAIEAAAMGCPVIATAIGAPPETVLAEPAVPEDAITGWLVPPGDAGALAERLAGALALAAAERAAIGASARGRMFWPISRSKPCSAARWPSTTGCWAPSLNGVLSAAPYHPAGRGCTPAKILTCAIISPILSCAGSGGLSVSTAVARRRPMQQPMETATYVVQ